MASEATIRDAILGATGTPPYSIGSVLSFLRQSNGYSTRVLELLGNHPEFKLRPPELGWSLPFVDANDFSSRWMQAVVAIA